jgi:protein phosphatase
MEYKWEIKVGSVNKGLDDFYENEDNYHFGDDLALIADGVSEKSGGGTASKIVVEEGGQRLRDMLASRPAKDEIVSKIEEIVQALNTAVRAAGVKDRTKYGMKTTLTLAVKYEDKVYIAAVGDSPAYVVKDGKMRKITKDDSSLAKKFEDSVSEEEMLRKIHLEDDRLTNSLGVKKPISVQIYEVPLEEVDYVVLMTDGVKKLATQGELEAIFDDDPEKIVEKAMDLVSNPVNVAKIIGKKPDKIANSDDATIVVIKSYREGN